VGLHHPPRRKPASGHPFTVDISLFPALSGRYHRQTNHPAFDVVDARVIRVNEQTQTSPRLAGS